MSDDIRPRGSVQVACSCGCRWEWWIDALDPRLPDGPFWMDGCSEACTDGKCSDGTPNTEQAKSEEGGR